MTLRKILTVSELTFLIKRRIEEDFFDLWVEGEVSNLRMPTSGHIYLTLKDESAQIRGVIFRSIGRSLKFRPEEGQQVLFRGHLTVYEPRGDYQLIVDDLEPRGLGALQAAFEQLKAKLEAEGLFDESRKRPLPMVPRRIGIITSPTGAVLQDMLRVLERRFPNLSVLICPVSVQGQGASGEIAAAIKELNSRGGLEVLVLARGGGSLEDLWAFNEEVVARAIAASGIPVVSAVGHETDYTISDFVADLRAPTPSAAAELVVRPREELLSMVCVLKDRAVRALRHRLEALGSLRRAADRALADPRKRLEGYMMRMDEMGWRASQAVLRLLREKKGGATERGARLIALRPDLKIRHFKAVVVSREDRILKRIAQLIGERRAILAHAAGRIDGLSPLAVLGRGYCIARHRADRGVIRESTQAAVGDELELQLYRGELICKVEEVLRPGPG